MARTSVWGVEKWRVRHYPTSEAIETCPRREDQQILPTDFFKDGSTPRRLSARVSASIPLSIATLRRAHASADFADLDRPSYLGPSPSGEYLYKLSLVFDGGDHETFSRGSRALFRTSQIPILEDVERPSGCRGLYAGEPLQATSQATVESSGAPESVALENRDHSG